MPDDMTFAEAIDLYRSIYQRWETRQQRPWGVEGAVMELCKQVGELAREVMTAEHYYYKSRPGYTGTQED